MSVLLDSDIVIEVLRARDRSILEKWTALIASGEEVLFSPITSAEIWEGARPSEHREIIACFDLLQCVDIDYPTGRLAGDLLREYRKSRGVELPDAMIAATAIQYGAALWTRNRKHYPMPQVTFY